MGYDVHITRRTFWADVGEPAISREEWQSILAADSDLERINEEDTAQMLGPSRTSARFFWYLDGMIFVKKPNRAVLIKMLEVAAKLGARVIGDEDEIYSQDGIPDKPTKHFTITEDW